MRHVMLVVTHESARMFVENFHEYMERERSECVIRRECNTHV